MRILIMMPMDERYVYASWGLYKNIANKEHTLNLLGFADYLYTTKDSKNWEAAAATALSIDSRVADIVIGNANKDDDFDIIFNMTDGENQDEYKDYVMEKFQERMGRDFNLHTADESKLCLVNFEAAAELINSLYENGKITEERLQEIKKDYEYRLALGKFGPKSEESSSK